MLFAPTPAVVSFTSYQAHKTITATVSMRNRDSVRLQPLLHQNSLCYVVDTEQNRPVIDTDLVMLRCNICNVQIARRIKAVDPNCSIFSVHAKGVTSKVAPGMESQFTVVFRPPTCEDYSCDIKFCTDRETFTVPVRALGARPLLQLPEVLNFGEACPCNSTSSRSVLARNVGRCAGKFQLSATAPYSVIPTAAVLNVGETIQCQVLFKPQGTGNFSGTLIAAASCGVEHTICLVGAAINMDVAVDSKTVSFIDTFVTKTSQRSFRVFNNTGQSIRFSLHKPPELTESQCVSSCSANMMDLVTAGSPGFNNNPEFGTLEMSAFPKSGLVLPNSFVEVLLWPLHRVASTLVQSSITYLRMYI